MEPDIPEAKVGDASFNTKRSQWSCFEGKFQNHFATGTVALVSIPQFLSSMFFFTPCGRDIQCFVKQFFQSRYAHFIKDSKSDSCRPASVALHATNMQEVKAKGELKAKKKNSLLFSFKRKHEQSFRLAAAAIELKLR